MNKLSFPRSTDKRYAVFNILTNNLKKFFYNKYIFYFSHIFFFSFILILLLINQINILEFCIFFVLLFYIFICALENKSNFTTKTFRPGSPLKFIAMYMQDTTIEGAEIGVYEGKHAEYIINNRFFKYYKVKLNKLSLIDPFSEFTDSNGENYFSVEEGNKFYENLKKRFNKYKNVQIIRKTSLEASKDFENGTLDFVYIDGNHQYIQFKQDIEIWYQKIKQYGVLCGDDYGIPYSEGIIRGLNEFSFEKKVNFHYVDNSTQWFLVKIEKS